MIIMRLISILLFVVLMIKVPVLANDKVTQNQFIASLSGVLKKCTLDDEKIRTVENLLDNERWPHVYWPSLDKAKKEVFFVAKDSLDIKSGSCIYQISSLALKQEPKKIIDSARLPSLGPDNNLIAFYRHPNQLFVYNLMDMKEKKIASDFPNYQPCVWLSKTQLMYINLTNDFIILDATNKEKKKTGYKDVIPGALSPDGRKALCGSSDGKKIYIYYLFSNKLKIIKENKFQSIGTSFIWLPDGNRFLFTMQTWSNILKLNESRDLFIYKLNEKEETHIFAKADLFGGAFIAAPTRSDSP